MGVDSELSRSVEDLSVANVAGVWPLAVDLQVPCLATLASGTFRSTARARWTLALIVASDMQDIEVAMLFNILYQVACYSDLLDHLRHE